MLSVTAFILGGCATVEHQAELEPLPDVADTGPLDELPQPDIWDRLRDGMAIPDHDHEATSSYRDWYSRNQSYLERVASRAEPYLYFILEEIEARDLPTELALLPVIESAYYPFAYSHGRAAGMWQFIPATGRIFGMRQDWWYDGRRDVHAATRGALEYLSRLHDQFDDWHLALAAYNAGSGNVRRAQRLARSGGATTTTGACASSCPARPEATSPSCWPSPVSWTIRKVTRSACRRSPTNPASRASTPVPSSIWHWPPISPASTWTPSTVSTPVSTAGPPVRTGRTNCFSR
ncbi:MAG: transglycosylase SLT domain-containing protein [Thiohalospira sp.]